MYKISTLILALLLLASNFVCGRVYADSGQVSVTANVLENITVIRTKSSTTDVTNGNRTIAITKIQLHDTTYKVYTVVF